MNRNMTAKTFAYRIHHLLEMPAFSREELARRTGVSIPIVHQWEEGIRLPDLYQLQLIASYFKLPSDWFLVKVCLPDVRELSLWLGLSEDTVSRLMVLADRETDDFLDILDHAVFSVVNSLAIVHNDD